MGLQTKVISVREEQIESMDSDLREAGNVLRQGGLVAFPTETVYGLGGDALNRDSSKKIYAAKGRPSDNPLIVHICRMEDLPAVVDEVTPQARALAEAFWPGPLTMILPKSGQVPCETTGGLGTVAVRMPSHRVALRLIEYGGGFIAAPSANLSGRPSPTLAKYVIEDMNGRVDVIIDGGEVGIGLESTIVDLTVTPPQILRPGYITQEMLTEVLGRVEMDRTIFDNDSGQMPKAPGMKYRHYAPKGELTIVEGADTAVAAYISEHGAALRRAGEKVGIICSEEQRAAFAGHVDSVKSVGGREDTETIAKRLYRYLREFDDEAVTVIYSESFDGAGMGQAVMNRLLKAAGHRVVRIPEA